MYNTYNMEITEKSTYYHRNQNNTLIKFEAKSKIIFLTYKTKSLS